MQVRKTFKSLLEKCTSCRERLSGLVGAVALCSAPLCLRPTVMCRVQWGASYCVGDMAIKTGILAEDVKENSWDV